MKLTEEKLLENWNNLIDVIEENFTGDRKVKLLDLYNKLQPEMMMAPASGFEHFHNCFIGGYVDHVLNVVNGTLDIYETWKSSGLVSDEFTQEELVFVALNHDLGKVGDIENPLYVPNDSEWHRKNQGKIYNYNSEIKTYMGIPDRSLWILNQYGISMSEQEYLGIKIHDGLYEEGNGQYLKPYNKDRALSSALPLIVHQADMMSSRIEYERWKSGAGVALKETRKIKRTKQVSNSNDSAKAMFKDIFGD